MLRCSSGSWIGFSVSMTSSDVIVALLMRHASSGGSPVDRISFFDMRRAVSAQALFEHVPGERGALHAHRELGDALERLEVAELRGRLVLRVGHHALEGVEQRAVPPPWLWPLTASVIIEPDAWLIEQPRPLKATSSMTPSSNSSSSSTSSPQSGL